MSHKSHIRTLMLPIAMVGGAVLYRWMGYITFLSPYLIFLMLTITYCRIEPKQYKPSRFHALLLAVQMSMAAVVYLLLDIFDHTVAEGVFMCVFIPTATAAPVITHLLGGSISKVATYSLLCNIFVAVFGPLILAAIGDHPDMTFMESFSIICMKVFPLLILPIVTSLALRYGCKRLHRRIVANQQLSFYLWAVALFIVVGSSVSFAINNFRPDNASTMIWLAAGALAVCLAQFKTGRLVGGAFGDKVSGGQGLGQKNTVLAIWLAIAYMNSLASIAPACYVAWQNIINSWQMYRHERAAMRPAAESGAV